MEVTLGSNQAAWFQNEQTWVTFDKFNHLEFWINGGQDQNHDFGIVLSADRGLMDHGSLIQLCHPIA